ncbi:MAG: invasion associated locus B family protein [Pseudomonadota bacterium]
MPKLHYSLLLIALVTFGTFVHAQETEAPAEDSTEVEENDIVDETEQTATDEDGSTEELDLGREVETDPSYIKEQYGDWQLQCFRTETGEDPCQMYQLLREEAGNPIAEFTVFRLPGTDQAVAGATIVVPLGTLLGEGLKMTVDNGTLKAYNYAFCSMAGCFARIGFTQEDIDAFKVGGSATLLIVPAQAPNQVVEITASLDGFTAAFNEVSVLEN